MLTLSIVLKKNKNFKVVFSSNFVTKFSKEIKIYNNTMYIIDTKQFLYTQMYNLDILLFKIIKTYSEINLANGFIKLYELYESISFLLLKE